MKHVHTENIRLYRAEFRHVVYFVSPSEEVEFAAANALLHELVDARNIGDPQLQEVTNANQIDEEWKASLPWGSWKGSSCPACNDFWDQDKTIRIIWESLNEREA